MCSETSELDDPKLPWTKRSKEPPQHSITILESQIYLFRSTTSHSWATSHFETSVPNNPKMTLNSVRSKVPHIHITTTPKSKNFIPFHPTEGQYFSSYRQFWDACTKCAKMTLNTKKVKFISYNYPSHLRVPLLSLELLVILSLTLKEIWGYFSLKMIISITPVMVKLEGRFLCKVMRYPGWNN